MNATSKNNVAGQGGASPLGREVAYPSEYDPGLLFSIPRDGGTGDTSARSRFFGADFWTAYELSWLNSKGKPQVAIGRFTIPCDSQCLIESKSFKLYLNSLNSTRFESAESLRSVLRADIGSAISRNATRSWTPGVRLVLPGEFESEAIEEPVGIDLDRLDVECFRYEPAPEFLQVHADQGVVQEKLYSNLMRSNCPVTGQPDWATVEVSYAGVPIDQAGLLSYLVSFRNHTGFHERCVEQIFDDIRVRCRPDRLSVLARYTRRGGLEINPLRTTYPQSLRAAMRSARQ